MTHYFGGHTLDLGGIDMAVRRAARANMRALQLFTAVPKYYGDKSSIRAERVDRFKRALAESQIAPGNVLVHAAYVLNTATPDEEKWIRARDGLAKELERSTAIGAGALCFHPGAATDGKREPAAARVGAAIAFALEQHPDSATRILVENTAGAGHTFGKTAIEVREILDAVPKAMRARTGYGLDTCHLFASGQDIRGDGIVGVLDAFEREIGGAPRFFHLNDSEGDLGTNKDRHMLIGEGKIGVGAFRALVADPRSRGIPLILETPQRDVVIAENDDAPDAFDVRMMELLESFGG